ncbi:type-F conjugative transfer system pilin assembly thiol-disulfide isomerase TrbB [Legionella longbeachae]|uniref:type-F conjugative transfer system pilin assembly thiol-disulfide isomerase TrbB n=1 Tax=Legionella longbeachae TaxID=450 RepID=UPI0009B74F3F|nr:type-F conjugative transfer system pilin assembly thiol-disulfide isomerase TrbB [Legionella longbeachae]ARB92966.1 type-F conjugative transfer system pilin assembly thiol-disulfide isomerase TrbB [Legionella longbeachae]RZV26618.1 type-F conjugative transfer system pilin assembly thiol-disulfide isomerase TrbB [Legionella longbeachae]UAK47141.1 type-F conjugative transfer system pilin assembly thiol-disulfide isomerase TrbB [Legionella longbeachae]VEE04205.1 conjugative transfer protein [Le
MRVALWIGFVLVGAAFNVQAGNGRWLTQITAEQERSVQPNPIEQPNRKNTKFFNNHGVILFYGSLCPHCRQFAPIVKRWAEQIGAEVLPLSFDNQSLPEFPHFLPATTEWVNAAFQGSPINYPAVFIMNAKEKILYPVGFGSMSEEELHARMDAVIAKINEYEHKEIG